jgi:hypothetical protein
MNIFSKKQTNSEYVVGNTHVPINPSALVNLFEKIGTNYFIYYFFGNLITLLVRQKLLDYRTYKQNKKSLAYSEKIKGM